MAKVAILRQLTTSETLDTLAHWKSHVRNYLKSNENYRVFFLRATVWDATKPNYGFIGEEAEEKADNLESVLDTIVSFMPGPFLTHDITNKSTSMEGVFKIIWDHYDATPSPATFMDFDKIFLQKEERFIDFYKRLMYQPIQLGYLTKIKICLQ